MLKHARLRGLIGPAPEIKTSAILAKFSHAVRTGRWNSSGSDCELGQIKCGSHWPWYLRRRVVGRGQAHTKCNLDLPLCAIWQLRLLPWLPVRQAIYLCSLWLGCQRRMLRQQGCAAVSRLNRRRASCVVAGSRSRRESDQPRRDLRLKAWRFRRRAKAVFAFQQGGRGNIRDRAGRI